MRMEMSSLATADATRKTFVFDETDRRLPEIASTRYCGFMSLRQPPTFFLAATSSTHSGSAPAHARWAYAGSRYRPHIVSSTWLFSPSAGTSHAFAAI